MTRAAGILSPLRLERQHGEGKGWRVLALFSVWSHSLDMQLDVPEGFETDLASVPRLPVVYLLTGATGDEPAVVHDFLYSLGTCTRKQADEVFYELALACGMPRWRAWLMWCGIRVGGGSHWKAATPAAAN